ncbi:predicted protein [Histoplasma capsulatum H143]|uniref:Uncharacterized protein n=1 Tax=Ajellomyces capsulatus (strain H143) TaxID=544712 RepID=C6H2N1_AJECH|nr:predicted protein [Histoplasma capsulatum H143]
MAWVDTGTETGDDGGNDDDDDGDDKWDGGDGDDDLRKRESGGKGMSVDSYDNYYDCYDYSSSSSPSPISISIFALLGPTSQTVPLSWLGLGCLFLTRPCLALQDSRAPWAASMDFRYFFGPWVEGLFFSLGIMVLSGAFWIRRRQRAELVLSLPPVLCIREILFPGNYMSGSNDEQTNIHITLVTGYWLRVTGPRLATGGGGATNGSEDMLRASAAPGPASGDLGTG